MARRRSRSPALLIAVACAVLLPQSVHGVAFAAAAPPAPAPAADTPSSTIDPQRRAELLTEGYKESQDVAWTTSGDGNGFHVLAATASSGYTWRTVATLAEPGFDADQWIGNACLTGSGRRLVVVYAPRTFTNKADLFDRGGFTATVDLVTGSVRKLPVQSSLAYFNPGCGADETAVLTQLGGQLSNDQIDGPARTRLFRLDAGKGELSRPILVNAEVTSALPVGRTIVAAGGSRLVQVGGGGTLTPVAPTSGTPFQLKADGGGGVLFMDRTGDRVRVRRAVPQSKNEPRTLAEGQLSKLSVTPGAGGRAFITGQADRTHALPENVSKVEVAAGSQLSSHGQLALTEVRWAGQADPRVAVPDPTSPRQVKIQATVLTNGKKVDFQVQPADAPDAQAAEGRRIHPKLASAGGGSRASAAAAGSPSNPVEAEAYCSVPRNDPRNQALQPKPRQVEWAVDQAITNSLYVQREANWKNLGMSAYRPQDLFPPIPLVGGGRVPAQVMLGIAAQESNLWQASFHAVPGVTASPLIGNYYGRDIYNGKEEDDWDIRWEDADCGYGVTQVTDGMRLAGREKEGEVALPAYKQRAIALDFAANIAAGLQILQSKWNETRTAGLIVNSGDPGGLEHWFFALWAYNSGFHPDRGDGSPWGVGWANNPINPRFRADRVPFLEYTYADAANPQFWPYQEKVLGFAGHPPELLEGPDQLVSGFRAAWWNDTRQRITVKPPIDLFCDDSNYCHPGELNVPDDPDVVGEEAGPCAHKNAAGRFDLVCWYNRPVKWKEGFEAGNEVLRFDPGYAYQEDATSYAPNCSLSGLPSGALVIDNVVDGTPSVRPGCGRPWTNAGTFNLDFAADSTGHYPSKIDFHQIGGGFGGHFWFAHTRRPDDQGGKFRVSGTWSLNQQLQGWGRVMVHMPDQGAHTRQAEYQVDLGQGFDKGKKRVLLQRTQEHRWVSLGVFKFAGTPRVRLSTDTQDGTGVEDVAWDAIAVQKLNAKPRHQVVALGDSYSSGEGASENRGADYYRETDFKQLNGDEVLFQNNCHRSRYSWSRQAVLSDNSASIGSRADSWDPQMDYQFHACSGARTHNLLPFRTVPTGQSPPANAFNKTGSGSYGEVSQLDKGFLDENTTLVTLSIGGNDSEFSKVIQECIYGSGLQLCQDSTLKGDTEPVSTATRKRIEGPVKESIKIVLREIHKKAPAAKILLMGYPKLVEGYCVLGIGAEELPWLNSTAELLATKMEEAVAEVKAEGVQVWFGNPTERFSGKAVCGSPETVNGVIKDLTAGEEGPLKSPVPDSWNVYGASQQSFHPKISGAGIYAEVMNDVTRGKMGL